MANESAPENRGRIYKAVKVTMIQGDMPLLDKFKLAKEVGFAGVVLLAGWLSRRRADRAN